MTCGELRAMAESYMAGALPVDTNHAVIAHLERCADCTAELEARVQLRQTLRNAFLLAPELAPRQAFLDRVRASALHDVAPRGRRFFTLATWMAVAAGVALVLALGWQRLPFSRGGSDEVLAALAAHAAGDHQNCAVHFALEQPPIPLEEAARRYDPIYAGLLGTVTTADTVTDGSTEILASHWCVFRGRPFAHVVVRHQGHVASLLLTPVDLGTPSLAPAAVCPAGEGFQVACFEARGHAGFVVSDLDQQANLALARHLAPVVQTYLSQG